MMKQFGRKSSAPTKPNSPTMYNTARMKNGVNHNARMRSAMMSRVNPIILLNQWHTDLAASGVAPKVLTMALKSASEQYRKILLGSGVPRKAVNSTMMAAYRTLKSKRPSKARIQRRFQQNDNHRRMVMNRYRRAGLSSANASSKYIAQVFNRMIRAP